jgi:hypothetical protein
MNTKLLLLGAIAAMALLRSTALAADNRLDGVWVGTESVMRTDYHGSQHSDPYEHKTAAKIVIAQGGTLVGVLEGYGPGRYSDVKRVGNTIVFHAGPRTGQLTLSPDGQTLVEKGVVPGSVIMGVSQRQGALSGHERNFGQYDLPKSTAQVTGTFHRER